MERAEYLRQLEYQLLMNPSRFEDQNESSEGGVSIEKGLESINNYTHYIPFDTKYFSFLEELIYEEYDTPISVSILTQAGPLTLLIYNRCLNLSFKYFEFRDLRMYSLVGNKCYEKVKN